MGKTAYLLLAFVVEWLLGQTTEEPCNETASFVVQIFDELASYGQKTEPMLEKTDNVS